MITSRLLSSRVPRSANSIARRVVAASQRQPLHSWSSFSVTNSSDDADYSTSRIKHTENSRSLSTGSASSSLLGTSYLKQAQTQCFLSMSQQQLQLQRRHYHATQKKEILPVIAVGAVLLVARYSYKAMKRMDAEWEDYQWALQAYEKQHRQDFVSKNTKYHDGTLAVDVGTMFVKLAHNGNGLLATREGSRTTFAGLVRTGSSSSDDDENVLLGQPAMEKYWEVAPFHPERVDMARKASNNSSQTLLKVITPAIHDALDRAKLDQSKMRSVITVPASSVADVKDPRNPWNNTTDNEIWKDAEWIPEPVASVWGAQVQGDLPLHDLKKPVLVVDMGANATSLSVVEKDVVQSSVTLDFGAQAYVDAICNYVIETQEALQTVKNDGMAWQRLVQAAQDAVQELNTKPDAQLNVPYIGMNLETREPIHLEMRIPRQIIEQKVTDHIVTDIILKYEDGSSTNSLLSPHVPVVPHSLSSLWMSIMTQLLTENNQQPQDLGHVLVVGGGAKHAMIEASLKECFGFFQTEVVMPPLSTRSELVVLGASSILPQYEYNLDEGLIRLEDTDNN